MGCWGVDALFILSGFLLGRPYIDALLGRRPLPNWKQYAKRRFFRIWPAYAIVVLIAFLKSALHHGVNRQVAGDTITHLLMIHIFFPQFVAGAENIALWTMAVDAQFYVVLPVAAWVLLRWRPQVKPHTIMLVLAFTILASLIWRLVIPYFSPKGVESILVFDRNILGMGMIFAVGLFLSYLSAQGIKCKVVHSRSLFTIAILATFVNFWIAGYIHDSALPEFIFDLLGTLSIALLVFTIPHIASRSLDGALKSRFLVFSAEYAYALYLLHVPVKQAVDSFLTSHGFIEGTMRYGIFFILGFTLSCGVGVTLLHRLVEAPFLTLKERTREIVAVPAV